jgi:hypothetical protein
MLQEASGSCIYFDKFSKHRDTTFKITKEYQPEVAHTDVLPQSDVIPLVNPYGHLSTRMIQFRYQCQGGKELKDQCEPINCHIALLDPESDKWFDDTNTELRSIKDNQVLDLDLSSSEQQDC